MASPKGILGSAEGVGEVAVAGMGADDDGERKAGGGRLPGRPELKKTRTLKGMTALTAGEWADVHNSNHPEVTTAQPRRKRAPFTARDYEAATSVVEASHRMALARQRSQVSFGHATIDLDQTFRTAPGGRPRIVLDSPTHSPKRNMRASSASFISPAQAVRSALASPQKVAAGDSPGSAAKKAKKAVSFQDVPIVVCAHEYHDNHSRDTNSVAGMLSPIHAACCKGDYLVLKHLLGFYCGGELLKLVNSICSCGMTPLQVVCGNGDVRIAKLLLHAHAQPNKCEQVASSKKRNRTCMAMACARKDQELVELLLHHGASIDEEALLLACSQGDLAIVKALLYYRQVPSSSSRTPAIPFLTHEEEEQSQTISTDVLRKAVSLAVSTAHSDALLPVLCGDGLTKESRAKLESCLFYAAEHADYKLLRALAKICDDRLVVDAMDAQSNTLLHHVVKQTDVKATVLLLRMGANVDARNGQGITPLYSACARGQSAIVRMLIHAGAKCSPMGPNKETPLHIAAQENHVNCVSILLTHGKVDVDLVTRDHSTALHLASQRGNTQVAECLLDHGANVNALTVANETPYVKASRMSHFQTAKLLLSRNAVQSNNQSSDPLASSSIESPRSSSSSSRRKSPPLSIEDSRRSSRIERHVRNGDTLLRNKSNEPHKSLKQWLRSVLKPHHHN